MQLCLKPISCMVQPWTTNKKHSLPEASLSCSQTTATVPLVLLSSLAFLPTGPGPNSALTLKAGKSDLAFISNLWHQEPF